MANKGKTKEELTKELAAARRRLAQLEALEAERTWAQQELRKTLRALKVLSGCNQVIIRATEEAKLLDEVCRVIVDMGGYRLAWVGFAEQDRKKTVRPVAQRGYEQGYLDTANITWADNEQGRGPTGTAIRTGKPSIVRDILTDPDYAPWRREAIKRGFASAIALPLGSGRRIFGALNIYATEPDAFDAEEVKLLTELADDLTYGITALHTKAEHQQAETALRKSEERYRTLVDNALVGVYRSNLKGDILYVNDALVSMFGFDSAEEMIVGGAVVRYKNPSDRAILIKELTEKGKVNNLELELLTKTGEIKNVIMNAALEGDTLSGMLIDITESKRLEEILKKSEQRYRTALDSLLEGCQIIDFNYRYLYLNNVAAQHGHRKREELLGHTMMEMYPGIENTEMFAHLRECLEKRCPQRLENRFTFPDGSQSWFELSIEPIPEGVFILSEDITERKRLEEQHTTVIRTSKDSFLAADREGHILDVNEATGQLLGYSRGELLTMRLHDIQATETAKEVTKHLSRLIAAGYDRFETRLRRKNGEIIDVEVSATYSDMAGGRIFGFARDITERKRMEEQLIVTGRLATIGQLVSGVAHELNNPLTSIIGFSELVLNKNIPEEAREDLNLIRREAQRTSQIVRNLLIFARQHPLAKQGININEVIPPVLELRAYEQRINNIRVITRFAPDLPRIMADSFQLQQVFLNIIINAEHFMIEAHKRGTLTISTEWVKDFVRVAFADDGPGIPPENLRRVFDPFFTTKEVGKGTGLGLSICHGIVTEHSGRLYAESEPGKGATFLVELPISQ